MPSKQVNNYSLEFKQSSAKLAVESEQSITKTAEELGVHFTTLHGWVTKFYPHYKARQLNDKGPLEQEIQQLRKENARLKQERDILKKAAAYFASETK